MQGDPGHIYSVYDDPTGASTPIETAGEAEDKRLAELFSSASAALTAPDAATVDATYGAEEAGVIGNLRTRVNEIESVLQEHGLLT